MRAASGRARRPLWERIRGNRFGLFFAFLILLFVLVPFAEPRSPLLPALLLLMVLAVSRTLALPRVAFRSLLGLGLAGFAVHASTLAVGAVWGDRIILAALALYAAFLGTFSVLMLRHVFRERNVTADTIQGGISLYFLQGIFWMQVYAIVAWFDPAALSAPIRKLSDSLYFSLTTLTTLGYGDISPVSPLARSLATLQATLGQLYVAVLVARLVGLHIARNDPDQTEPALTDAARNDTGVGEPS